MGSKFSCKEWKLQNLPDYSSLNLASNVIVKPTVPTVSSQTAPSFSLSEIHAREVKLDIIDCGNKNIYIVCGPADLRNGCGGLAAITDMRLACTAFESAMFLFCNRSRNLVKIIEWDGDGFWQLLDSPRRGTALSQKGYLFDNAICECFFKYLKREETGRRTYRTFNELQLSVFEYIEGYCNSRRPHSARRYLTPNEAESAYRGRK